MVSTAPASLEQVSKFDQHLVYAGSDPIAQCSTLKVLPHKQLLMEGVAWELDILGTELGDVAAATAGD